MISQIEALNYRCLRYVKQPLGPFHVLVGPNASGKTTFLDVVAFLSDLVSGDLETALERTSNFSDLVFNNGMKFELAVEAPIPKRFRSKNGKEGGATLIRYEVRIEFDATTLEIRIGAENVWLLADESDRQPPLRSVGHETHPRTIIQRASRSRNGPRMVLYRRPDGHVSFFSEPGSRNGKTWPPYKLGVRKSAFAALPDDEATFRAALWMKESLRVGVQRLAVESRMLRRASPPGRHAGFKVSGSNLPWVVNRLRMGSRKRFAMWLAHVRAALPDLDDVRAVERQDDKHRYLMIRYRNGLEIPSWMASDGTLRLLALTLPAYIEDFTGTYLIEEPENGLHPRAVETLFQSLSSVYDAQVLVATHSPVILGLTEPKQLLCFAKTDEGGTNVICGSAHPALQEWQKGSDLGVLYGAGVLD